MKMSLFIWFEHFLNFWVKILIIFLLQFWKISNIKITFWKKLTFNVTYQKSVPFSLYIKKESTIEFRILRTIGFGKRLEWISFWKIYQYYETSHEIYIMWMKKNSSTVFHPSRKIEAVNKAFLFWYWLQLRKYFFKE